MMIKTDIKSSNNSNNKDSDNNDTNYTIVRTNDMVNKNEI